MKLTDIIAVMTKKSTFKENAAAISGGELNDWIRMLPEEYINDVQKQAVTAVERDLILSTAPLDFKVEIVSGIASGLIASALILFAAWDDESLEPVRKKASSIMEATKKRQEERDAYNAAHPEEAEKKVQWPKIGVLVVGEEV